MKTEPRDVNRVELARLVGKEYGPALSAPTFLAEGEESYAYLARDERGTRHFIRLVEDAGQRVRLEAAYAAVEALSQMEDLSGLVAPRRTRRDAFLCTYRGYLVALFPFMEGRSLYQAATPEDQARVAEVVAALHDSDLPALDLPKEGLENPFETPIQRALIRVESPMARANRYQGRVADLLTAHREDVENSMRHMGAFRAEEEALVAEWTLTHGEPHLDNFVKDSHGGLHLTDSGDLAWGPPERDLFFFVGPDFERYLKRYLRRRRATPPRPRLFEFYFYRWALQEIADYSTRILFRRMGPEEDAHSWAELRYYLPTRHDEIARAMREVREVLGRMSS